VPALEEPVPITAPTTPPGLTPVSQSVPAPAPKIVVIDDDRITLTYTIMTLKREGYEVHRATDGESGLGLVRQLKPDLIICDWMMPGTTGIQVCRTVKQDPELATAFLFC